MKRGSELNRFLDRWLGIPILNLAATGKRRKQLPARVRRIGVFCSPALGDTLLFSGPLQDLRTHFLARQADTEIVHFFTRENQAAAELIPGADRLVLIDLTRPHQSIAIIRRERLDVFLDFSPWQRITAFHSLLSGASFTAGFKAPQQYRHRAYHLAVDHRSDLHELENHRALVKALGCQPKAAPVIKQVDTTAEEWRQLWEQSVSAEARAGIDGTEDLVVLHPWAAGAKFWLREWPEARWIEFANRLARAKPGVVFAVTGGPKDQSRVASLVEGLRSAELRGVGFFGPGGLKPVVSLLRQAKLAVCVNTGIMHLSAIVGTPTLALNGPTAEHRWGPRGQFVKSVNPEDGSGGYLNFGYEYTRASVDVMSKISVERAFELACELLIEAAESSCSEFVAGVASQAL
jgi:ADP-heptose:LPS heptosyltransferase